MEKFTSGRTENSNVLSLIPHNSLSEMLCISIIIGYISIGSGFSVNNAILTRFFIFHFLLPLGVAAASTIGLGIIFLHQSEANNPLISSIPSLLFL